MHNLNSLNEQELVRLIKKGDEAAIATLLERHKNKLFYTSYLLVKDRYLAEDFFQEACIKVITSIRKGKYAEEGKFLPYAARVIRNLSLDHLRKVKRQVKVSMPDGSDIFDWLNVRELSHEDKIMKQQSCKKVRSLLAEIPYEQRETIVLRLYGELSFKEIAELTNVSVNTCLGRMRYGLLALRKRVKELQIQL